MQLQQGLMSMRTTHVLFGLWSTMQMQRGLGQTRKTQVLLGGRLRAKRRGHSESATLQ
jgi:hypothetical protein